MNDLAVVTTYFNYTGYDTIRSNYFKFAKHIEKLGLSLHTMEIAFDNQPFCIDKSYKYRSNSVLWYKENLINIAISNHIPKECKYIAWVDADIEFPGIEVFEQLRDKLEEYPIVQMFNKIIRLDKRGLPNNVYCSIPYWLQEKDKQTIPYCLPGFAWAARRDFIINHSLFDSTILGSGDSVLSTSLFGWFQDDVFNAFNSKMHEYYRDWGQKIYKEVDGYVGFVDYPIRHWWHGEELNRNYSNRDFLYQLGDFDPFKDISKDNEGLIKWTGNNPFLEEGVRRYFPLRRDDG